MTAVDGDGIDEDLTRAVSVAMLAAARAGEQVARMTQAAAREREARAAGNAAEAQRQVDAHTEAAKAYFEVVTRPEYLSVATDEQLREVTQQADVWRERLPEAQRAADVSSRALLERRPGPIDEQAAVLAAEGHAADRRAGEVLDANHGIDASGLEPLPETAAERHVDRVGAGKEAAATAQVAQARPAREAPRSSSRRSVPRRTARPVKGKSAAVER